jgi:hypothetical protein
VYDRQEFRNYVNGVQQGAATIAFSPQGPGRTSIGVRINEVYYFKAAIQLARSTRRALVLPGERWCVGIPETTVRSPLRHEVRRRRTTWPI